GRGERRLSDFHRTIHGTRNSIATVIRILHSIEHYAPPQDPDLQFLVPDGLSHLENLMWQIDRVEKRETEITSLGPVRIYSEVLVQARDLAQKLAASMSVHVDFSGLGAIDARTVPLVRANREGLLVVFRNLVENAMKYCGPSRRCRIEVSVEDVDSNLC